MIRLDFFEFTPEFAQKYHKSVQTYASVVYNSSSSRAASMLMYKTILFLLYSTTVQALVDQNVKQKGEYSAPRGKQPLLSFENIQKGKIEKKYHRTPFCPAIAAYCSTVHAFTKNEKEKDTYNTRTLTYRCIC